MLASHFLHPTRETLLANSLQQGDIHTLHSTQHSIHICMIVPGHWARGTRHTGYQIPGMSLSVATTGPVAAVNIEHKCSPTYTATYPPFFCLHYSWCWRFGSTKAAVVPPSHRIKAPSLTQKRQGERRNAKNFDFESAVLAHPPFYAVHYFLSLFSQLPGPFPNQLLWHP